MRKLVVFLLIVSMLLLMASPAYAVGFDAVSVAADIVLQSIVMGLGVFPKSGQESSFNDLITSVKSSPTVSQYIVDGINIGLFLTDPLSPSSKRFVDKGLVQAVSDFLWAGDISSAPVVQQTLGDFSFVTSFTDSSGLIYSSDFPVIPFNQSASKTWVLVWPASQGSKCKLVITRPDGSSYTYSPFQDSSFKISGVSYIRSNRLSGVLVGVADYPSDLSSLSFGSTLTDDFVSGTIGQSASITSYPAWVDTETQVVGQTGVLTDTLALGLVDTLTQAIAMTQEQVIALQDAIQKAEVATQPEVPDGGDFTIDLRQFFPFCIPFDIYAILSALSAEPETPHLDFELDLGITKLPVHADLSAFDSAAAMLRKLELVLFIVGLGMVTREKFLRG